MAGSGDMGYTYGNYVLVKDKGGKIVARYGKYIHLEETERWLVESASTWGFSPVPTASEARNKCQSRHL